MVGRHEADSTPWAILMRSTSVLDAIEQGAQLLLSAQRRAIGDRAVGFGLHVERQRFVPRRADFQAMRSRLERQRLARSVEGLHQPHETAVDVHKAARR